MTSGKWSPYRLTCSLAHAGRWWSPVLTVTLSHKILHITTTLQLHWLITQHCTNLPLIRSLSLSLCLETINLRIRLSHTRDILSLKSITSKRVIYCQMHASWWMKMKCWPIKHFLAIINNCIQWNINDCMVKELAVGRHYFPASFRNCHLQKINTGLYFSGISCKYRKSSCYFQHLFWSSTFKVTRPIFDPKY